MPTIRERVRTALGIQDTTSYPASSSFELQFPVLAPLKDVYQKVSQTGNTKQQFRLLKEVDPELAGAIDKLGMMVKTGFQGFYVNPGEELDKKEKELQKVLDDFSTTWKIPGHYYAITDGLMTYGDQVYVTKFKRGIGLYEFRPLPMEYLTAVDRRQQIGEYMEQIFEANFYILNEAGIAGISTFKEIVWPATEITHFPLSNISRTIYDLRSRYTFGVWSTSPIESLKPKLLWKLSLLINDMTLRQHLVPRQHHKVDLSAFRPEYFAGATLEARMEAAKTKAQEYLTEYKNTVATPLKEVDKSIITDKNTEITYLEPQHVTYVDPNPLMDNIVASIYSAIGPLQTATTGKSQRTYATELVVSTYITLIVEYLGDIIGEHMLPIVKKHIELVHPGKYTEQLETVTVKTQLVLGIERGELVRQAAVLAAAGLVTPDEIRDMLGLGPLTEDKKKEIEEMIARRGKTQGRTGDYDRTSDDEAANFMDSDGSREPVTPQSRRDRQQT